MLTDALSADINYYNARAQAAGDAAGVGVTEGIEWSAVVSTPTVDARDNAVVSAPVYSASLGANLFYGPDVITVFSTDRVADGYDDMWSPERNPSFGEIDCDGLFGSCTETVWTGSFFDGTAARGGTIDLSLGNTSTYFGPLPMAAMGYYDSDTGTGLPGDPDDNVSISTPVDDILFHYIDALGPDDGGDLFLQSFASNYGNGNIDSHYYETVNGQSIYALSEELTVPFPLSAVPEPSTYALAVIGLLGLLAYRRFR